MAEPATKDYVLYEVEDVAKICHVHPATVRQWLRDGLIKGVRLPNKWLIPESVLAELVTARHVD
jgi:excisionase family DNA binding protein